MKYTTVRSLTFAFLLITGFAALFTSPASGQTVTSAHIISTEGTLNASGQYSQTTGNFVRVIAGTPVPTPTPVGTPSPTPTASPSPSPTPCVPSPGSPGGTFYVGVYTLSNGESGNFFLNVETGTNAAAGGGSPEELPVNPQFVETGPATITLQVNVAGTGTGTIAFTSNGTPKTGTIVIITRITIPPTDPVTCGTPTPTPTPAASPTPSPSPSPTPGQSTADISGRVLTPSGTAIRNTQVTLTDSLGVRRVSTTSSFGTYQFLGINTGQTCTLTVSSKRYRFAPRLVPLTATVANIDLVGLE